MERDACDLLIGSAEQTSSSDLLAEMPMDLDFPETEDGFLLPRDPEKLGKLLVGAGAFLSSRVIRRSLLTEHNIFFDEDLLLMEDHVFNARCYAHAERICVMPGIVAYTYVQHDGSLLQRVSRENGDPERKKERLLNANTNSMSIDIDVTSFQVRLFIYSSVIWRLER